MASIRDHRNSYPRFLRTTGLPDRTQYPPVETLTDRANDGLFALVLGLGMVVAFVLLTTFAGGGP